MAKTVITPSFAQTAFLKPSMWRQDRGWWHGAEGHAPVCGTALAFTRKPENQNWRQSQSLSFVQLIYSNSIKRLQFVWFSLLALLFPALPCSLRACRILRLHFVSLRFLPSPLPHTLFFIGLCWFLAHLGSSKRKARISDTIFAARFATGCTGTRYVLFLYWLPGS